MLPAIGLSEVSTILAQHMVAMLRIGAFLLASPVFGGRFVPLPVRIMAAAVIALPVMISVPLPSPDMIADLRFIPVIMTELAIGLTAGLILTVMFSAAALAGDRIASTAGLGFAAQFDPTSGSQAPIVSSIFGLFLLSVFLGSDGHLLMLRMMLESYSLLPIGAGLAPGVMETAGLESGSMMLSSGAAIMLPVVSVLLLLNIVIGILTRSAPQLNVFSFGFPVTMSATIALIFLYAPGLISSFEDLVSASALHVSQMLEAANGGQ